jgi:uncharacterized protein (TIGR03084 family)
VLDVVIHLAQTDELAAASVAGRFDARLDELAEGVEHSESVDEGAADLVARDRDLAVDPSAVLERWRTASETAADAFDAADPHARVQWVAGELAVRTLATTRLAEAWIHSGDVAEAIGVTLEPSDRLRQIARLAWRTLPYAFGSAGLTLAGPVELRLTGPSGDPWDFVPDEPAVTVVRGPAADLCDVAARRRTPSDTRLATEGPDGAAVLDLIRTYA